MQVPMQEHTGHAHADARYAVGQIWAACLDSGRRRRRWQLLPKTMAKRQHLGDACVCENTEHHPKEPFLSICVMTRNTHRPNGISL